jgi:hypothetical protein
MQAGVDACAISETRSSGRPGGNATGFMTFEFSVAGKWLELLKQIAPSVTRVAVLRDFTNSNEVDENRQASRDEKGDRGAGASVGRDHASHLG